MAFLRSMAKHKIEQHEKVTSTQPFSKGEGKEGEWQWVFLEHDQIQNRTQIR